MVLLKEFLIEVFSFKHPERNVTLAIGQLDTI